MSAFDLTGKRILIAGDKGMVGSALMRRLESESCVVMGAGRSQVDLLCQADVEAFVQDCQPDIVIIAAAKVGGIMANSQFPGDFIYQNLMITTNLIHASHLAGVNRLLNLGSSCIYPKFAEQPIIEAALLTGPLEPTNEWYAIAKIAGLKTAQAYRRQYGRAYISAMPTNLYGVGDNFDLASSHVLPALINKAHHAKVENSESFEVWGTGLPRREFLNVDDCADALVFLLKCYDDDEHINVGSGTDISIFDLAHLVAKVVGFKGKVITDDTKPDGTPRKLMSNAKLSALGWEASKSLEQGIKETYEWYLANTDT